MCFKVCVMPSLAGLNLEGEKSNIEENQEYFVRVLTKLNERSFAHFMFKLVHLMYSSLSSFVLIHCQMLKQKKKKRIQVIGCITILIHSSLSFSGQFVF